jgi:hyperosmotically inducible protein
MTTFRSKSTASLALMLVLALGGCASTRTQQAPGEAIDDRVITGRVKAALVESPDVKAGQIDVETFRGVVQLNGFVDSSDKVRRAASIARGTSGVREVRNNLRVSTESTSVGEVIDDSLLTAKVKAALVNDPVTKARQINVETRDGVVQLSGFVDSADEQRQASEVARGITGVKRVDNKLDVKQRS